MIYLKNTEESQTLLMPRCLTVTAYDFQLVITSTVTRKVVFSDTVSDRGSLRHYYRFSVSLPEATDNGEYAYELRHGGKAVASGLMIVGDYKPQNNVYDTTTEIKQYNG